ncbi:MAG TPA: NADH-quinone oxidoreductase subunit NuoE [Spirochaetia bacterium]|nr:NADH-quinone oxidoreductase subunit NuoE [Spirochaetia bacterium]
MLSDKEKQLIEAEAQHHDQRRGAVSEALMILQRSRGWVSSEAISDVADALGMSIEEVDGIATFYDLIYRSPVGKHVIMVCDSVSCFVMGEPRITDHLRSRLGVELGGTTADGMFTLIPVGCLGACDRGPALLVDGEIHEDITPERADEIIARCRKESDAHTAHG